MAKKKQIFECQACGYQSGKWLGKCPNCGEWDSFVELSKFEKSPKAPTSHIINKVIKTHFLLFIIYFLKN